MTVDSSEECLVEQKLCISEGISCDSSEDGIILGSDKGRNESWKWSNPLYCGLKHIQRIAHSVGHHFWRRTLMIEVCEEEGELDHRELGDCVIWETWWMFGHSG